MTGQLIEENIFDQGRNDQPHDAHQEQAGGAVPHIIPGPIMSCIIAASYYSAARSNLAGSVSAISSTVADAMPFVNRHPLTNP